MDVRSLAFRTDLALLALGGSVVEDRGTHREPGYNPLARRMTCTIPAMISVSPKSFGV